MMSMQTDTAKYKAIFEALKEEILGGKYSATRKLPSEAQLMRRFGGSRVTPPRSSSAPRREAV